MNTLSIFLGSSFHLSHERIVIGDGIRKLSDLWEQKGVRIHLLIWEDYRSEYTGQSKQLEYDRDLVEKSDIVFAMFRKSIGPWTEHELDVALASTKQPDIHCFCLPDNNRNSYIAYLQAKGINTISVNNEETILSHITKIIEKFIASHSLVSASTTTYPAKFLYATIPSDMKTYRPQLGNMVRAIDTLAERQLNLRLRLHSYNTPAHIDTDTDHYLALFNNKTNCQEEAEFKTAVEAIDQHRRLAAITVFKQSHGRILADNHCVGPLLKNREIFTVSINSTDRIQLKLLLWLYNIGIPYIDINDVNISFHNNKITFFGCPVADVSVIDTTHEIRDLIAKKVDLDKKIQQLSCSTEPNRNNLLFSASTKNNAIKIRIMTLIVLELNNLLFNPSKYVVDETQEIDVTQLLEAAELEAQTLDDIRYSYSKNWNRSQKVLYDRIEYLRQHQPTVADIESISNLADARNKIIRLAYEHGLVEPKALFEALLYTVSLADTYFADMIEYDEDALFEQITALSDATGLTNPLIEMIRLNLGNAFARKGDFQQALNHYRTALAKFSFFNTSTPAVRNYLAHLFITVITESIEYYPHNPELKNWISEFLRLSAQWYSENDSYIVQRAMALACYLAEVEFKAYIGKEIAQESESVMEILLSKNLLTPEDGEYGDIYCYFPNAIGRYYMEQIILVKDADHQTYFHKASKYLSICLEKSKALEDVNYAEYLNYASDAHHNFGYLLASVDYAKALKHYKEALTMRRSIFEATAIPENEKAIAETLINTCWVYVYYMEDVMKHNTQGGIMLPENPLAIADEAFEIYSRHYKKDIIGLETRYYTALLLKGYLQILLSCTDIPTDAKYGIQCLKQCAEWDRQNPNNDQHNRIQDIVRRFKGSEGQVH